MTNRVGGVDDAAVARTASASEWERYAEKRAADLLRLDSAAAALDLLQLREDRLPASRLHLIESLARRSLPEPDLARAEAAAQRAVAAARERSNPVKVRNASEELVQVRCLHNDAAGVLRALAELGDLGDQLGDDLILLEAEVSALEAAPLDVGEERFSDTAIRVFGRLPAEHRNATRQNRPLCNHHAAASAAPVRLTRPSTSSFPSAGRINSAAADQAQTLGPGLITRMRRLRRSE